MTDEDLVRQRIDAIEACERQALADADELRYLRAREPVVQRLFAALAASPEPLHGDVAAAFYALREIELGA